MRFEGGYLRLGRWRSVPIRVHWSTPLGALFFSGFSFAPGLWLGIVLVILIHEMGHAVLVRSRGLHTTSIEIHALGGVCRYAGWPSPLDTSIIAWGGVLFQGLLAIATVATLQLAPQPGGAFMPDLVAAFVRFNLMMIALNLLPIPGLDGWEAWRLFGRLPWKKWRRSLTPRRSPPVQKPTTDPDEIVRQALLRARAETRTRRKDQLQ